jgi:hypothetical protein
VLREWGLKEFISVTELVVSELISNSVRATQAASWPVLPPPVRLWLLSGHEPGKGPAGILVHVWDGITDLPVARCAGPDDESGRGLTIVGELSEAWSSYRTGHRTRDGRGKVTWALITAP